MTPPDKVKVALAQACQEAGLATEHQSFVLSFLDRKDEGWRECCGSNCEPCSLPLAKAVDRLRELLEDCPAD